MEDLIDRLHKDFAKLERMREALAAKRAAKLPPLTKERLEEIKSSRLKAEALLAETRALIAKYPSELFTAVHAFHSYDMPYGLDFADISKALKSRLSELGLIMKEFDMMIEELCLSQKNLEENQNSIRCKRDALRKEHISFIEEVEALHPQLQKEVETIHNECLFELEKLVGSASIFSTLLVPHEEDHVTARIVGIEEREMTTMMMMIQPCEA